METSGRHGDTAAAASAPSPMVRWLRAPAWAPNVFAIQGQETVLPGVPLAAPLALALVVVATILVFTTETYVSNGGIGDDGIYYTAILRAYDGHVRHIPSLGLNSYMAQRCLNPILVRIGM